MNKLSLIAAVAAAGLLVEGWYVSAQLSKYAASNVEDNSMPPAWRHRPPLLPIVNAAAIHHDATAQARAPKVVGVTLSLRAYQQYRRHIDQNIQRYNSVRQIARECHSNVDYLNQLFQRYGHVSLDHYFAHLKRNQADGFLVLGYSHSNAVAAFAPEWRPATP